MNDLPATTATQAAAIAPPARRSALQSVKAGTLKMLGKARSEVGETIEAAGVSVEKMHRRLILVIAGLIVMLFLGALFRSLGLAWMNYALIAGFGLAALYAFLQPTHLVGLLLVGGGVAVVRGAGTAGGALLGYGRILARIFLAFLIPLLLFALAPGDRSLGASLPFVVLAPVVVLALWLFGRVAPKLEEAVFIGLPLLALLIALGNMLIPERALASLGVPAWMRTGRPQDDELAKVERLVEQRRNEARAAQLREIRTRLERGEAITPEDEAVIAAAKQDRVTLTGWMGDRYKDLEASVTALAAKAPRAAAKPVVQTPETLVVPAKGWSAAVAVPAGFRVCASGFHRAQCQVGGAWLEGSKCDSAATDSMRYRGRGGSRTVSYRLVKLGERCG